jgi:hypothetical protein
MENGEWRMALQLGVCKAGSWSLSPVGRAARLVATGSNGAKSPVCN